MIDKDMNADKDTTETYKLNELVDNKNVDIADNQHQNNPEGVSDEPGSSQDKRKMYNALHKTWRKPD